MNIDQLRAFANSDELHIRQIALTREAARAIIAEHEREVAIFDLVDGNSFKLTGRDDGPYRLQLSIVDPPAPDDQRSARP